MTCTCATYTLAIISTHMFLHLYTHTHTHTHTVPADMLFLHTLDFSPRRTCHLLAPNKFIPWWCLVCVKMVHLLACALLHVCLYHIHIGYRVCWHDVLFIVVFKSSEKLIFQSILKALESPCALSLVILCVIFI
jgi:hypothetical protein